MMRYAVLNLVVLAGCIGLFLFARMSEAARRAAGLATLVVAGLTIVFDPLIIASGIVAYTREFTLGLTWFNAPIEDLAYTLAAGLLIPVLWRWYGKED